MCSRNLTWLVPANTKTFLFCCKNFKEGEAEEQGMKEDKNKHTDYPGCCKAFIAFAWEDLHNSTRPELEAIKSLKESVPSYVLSIAEFHKQCKHGILPGSSPRGRLLHTQIRMTFLVLFPIVFSCLCLPLGFHRLVYFPDYYPKGNRSNEGGFGIH